MKLLLEAFQNLLLHKSRSSLAILGVIFGVASVICMLSISEVARRDVISRIERMGLQNVILDSVKPEDVRQREKTQSEQSWYASYGVTREDLETLRATIPSIETVVPMRILLKDVRAGLQKADVTVVATNGDYPRIMEHPLRRGRFIVPADEARATPVCALGSDAAAKLFPLSDPLGQMVRIEGLPFHVVGVMERKGQTGSHSVLSHPDLSAYVGFHTSFARFGAVQIRSGSSSSERTKVEMNRAILRVPDTTYLAPVAQAASNLMQARHRQSDFEVSIPFSLLNEHRQAENIFRWVMGSLAAISLLVGGIGIMNIMLANLAERRQEIGLRRALGALQGDVVRLFLCESTLLCGLGGLIGLAVGAGLAVTVGQLANWTVFFQPLAFPLGLGVSIAVGLLFGTLPALKAARLDPVLALKAE